jgi:hypothetical protein
MERCSSRTIDIEELAKLGNYDRARECRDAAVAQELGAAERRLISRIRSLASAARTLCLEHVTYDYGQIETAQAGLALAAMKLGNLQE